MSSGEAGQRWAQPFQACPRSGLTYDQIAQQTGLREREVSLYCRGKQVPTTFSPLERIVFPLLGGTQRQGDLLVLPLSVEAETPMSSSTTATVIPANGLTIVLGEATNNTHVLLATAPGRPRQRLRHRAALGLAPGSYRLRRQREETPVEPRLLSD